MDSFGSITEKLSQVTLYDIKSMYNQAKNMVLNLTEMEAKVSEATNDEPWGASSTLMNEIAQGTFNFQQFNEIMPAIYGRFMEKEARQWRQIYKALQLLEYLIKNGSERTVDDARSHIGTIKMLRNFHYIDDKGKDQGINVRNRAKEIVELLNDLDKVRAERRKAKANKSKYSGTGNDAISFSSDSGSRYGGFGSDSLYGSGGGGGGGGGYDQEYRGSSSYGGGGSSSFRDEAPRRGGFQEYDAGDDEDRPPRSSIARSDGSRRQGSVSSITTASAPAAPPPKAKAPDFDLLGGLDDDTTPAVATTTADANKALPSTQNAFDTSDDFGDFAAAPQTQPTRLPTTIQPSSIQTLNPKPNLFEMLGQNQPTATVQPQLGHTRQLSGGIGGASAPIGNTGSIGMGFGLGGGLQPQPARPIGQQQASFGGLSSGGVLAPTLAPTTLQPQKIGSFSGVPTSTPAIGGGIGGAAAKPKPSGGGFDDLWNLSRGPGTSASSTAGGAAKNTSAGKSILELEREKAQAGIWGSNPALAGNARKPTLGGGPPGYSGSSSFGNFGSAAPPSSGGNDDLLL